MKELRTKTGRALRWCARINNWLSWVAFLGVLLSVYEWLFTDKGFDSIYLVVMGVQFLLTFALLFGAGLAEAKHNKRLREEAGEIPINKLKKQIKK